MSLRTSDYEERVFHELAESQEPVTLRCIASRTNVKDATVRRIVSTFEDMELVQRVRLYPEEAFILQPSGSGAGLKKYLHLLQRSRLISKLRKKDTAAHARYAQTRQT